MFTTLLIAALLAAPQEAVSLTTSSGVLHGTLTLPAKMTAPVPVAPSAMYRLRSLPSTGRACSRT